MVEEHGWTAEEGLEAKASKGALGLGSATLGISPDEISRFFIRCIDSCHFFYASLFILASIFRVVFKISLFFIFYLFCYHFSTLYGTAGPLSTGFIIYRYGLNPVHSASHRWSCPFPPHDALPNGACLSSFDTRTIRAHIADHVNAYLAQHPDGKLECPRRLTEERCMWAEDRGSLKTVGPNTGLPRHVTEVHLQVSAYTCPCGTSFSRGTRDQFVRHLRDGHERNLAVKRRTDPTVPGYVSVDDPMLIDEEKQWLRSTGQLAEREEDDRGEGSSTGVKRARRFQRLGPDGFGHTQFVTYFDRYLISSLLCVRVLNDLQEVQRSAFLY
ncbi:hypothetical protein ACEPAF_5683 [Sanghuangporus sanghuang]